MCSNYISAKMDTKLQVNEGVKENENEEEELAAVLTSPLSLDGDSANEYRAPNLLQRIFSLLKNVRPGSDLTRFSALVGRC
ncbi:hypothetical protein HanOQP8_Chr12g0433991 [Helianthus annuus]|nr:hypothetical protein HanOQP8_Chr12g0433991 [Helianthus annuus]